MSTIAATVSIMEDLPESSRQKILIYAQEEYKTVKPNNPFAPLTRDRILSDIETSERQIDEGKGIDAEEAILSLRKKYGFA